MYLTQMSRLVDLLAQLSCCEEHPELLELSHHWMASSRVALPLIAASSLTTRLLVDCFSAVNSAAVVMTRTD